MDLDPDLDPKHYLFWYHILALKEGFRENKAIFAID